MKTGKFLMLPLLLILFLACDKEEADTVHEPEISGIAFLATSSVEQPQEISVTVQKPTPCHRIVEVKETREDNIYNYDFIIAGPGGDTVCADVIAEETVKVLFNPSSTGVYTLNFLINGELYETREITVTE